MTTKLSNVPTTLDDEKGESHTMMNNKMICILFCLCMMLVGCVSTETLKEDPKQIDHESLKEPDDLENKRLKAPENLQLPKETEITLTAIGDILIHDRVYNDAAVTDKGYDFYPKLKYVEPYLNQSTVTFANQETMIGGEEFGLSSYPTFNSPVEVGEVLKEIGVDVVSIANNHTLDRGEEVIQSAIRHWDNLDMMYVGAYKDKVDRDTKRIMDTKEGISLGFLAYTYGTNGIPIPEGKDYLVNLIDKDRMANDIAKMKKEADVIIVSMHLGDEYVRMPNKEQKDLVQFLADKGVHIALGHHPHVLQPTEWVEGKDGNNMFVIYSLGNFFSGQKELYQKLGGIITLTITKQEKGNKSTIDVHSPEFTLTYNASEGEKNYMVYPWSNVTEEMLPDHEAIYEEMYQHMTQWMPELKFID